jgi:hypothetical protein
MHAGAEPDLQNWSCMWCERYNPGFKVVTVLSNKLTGVYGFVGFDKSAGATVISFRGSDNDPNWILDVDFVMVNVSYPNSTGLQVRCSARIASSHCAFLRHPPPHSHGSVPAVLYSGVCVQHQLHSHCSAPCLGQLCLLCLWLTCKQCACTGTLPPRTPPSLTQKRTMHGPFTLTQTLRCHHLLS